MGLYGGGRLYRLGERSGLYAIRPPLLANSADFRPFAATFDGTNDYASRGSIPTGLVDGKAGTTGVWFNLAGGDGANLVICMNTGGIATPRFAVFRNASNKLRILGKNAAGTNILVMDTVASYTAGGGWKHLLASWDLAAGVGHLYVNDASDRSGVGLTLTNDTIDYANTNWFIGADSSAGSKFNGSLAEYWFDPAYLDITVEANRRKFYSAAGKAADLGSNGSRVTGSAPILYHSIRAGEAVTAFATNRGTGGNFTITGSLDLAAGPNG